MAITLRTVKGSPITAVEHDENVAQLFYSASISGENATKKLYLHYTGSSTISFAPRSVSFDIPEYTYWAISDGTNSENIPNTATVIFSGSNFINTSYTVATNKLNISHGTVTRSNTTSALNPVFGGSFTVLDSLSTNSEGHVTGVNTKTITLPSSDNTDVDVNVANLITRLGEISTNYSIGDAADVTGSLAGSLIVTGSGEILGNISANNFITTSDIRLKSDLKPIQNSLETLKSFVSYEYTKNGEQDAGFVAQEVGIVLPYATGISSDGYMTMRDRPILAYIHKAILELEERIVAIEEKLE